MRFHCTGLQTTRFHVAPYMVVNGNFRNFGANFRHSTVFAPKQCLYQKEATEMESLKLGYFGRCKTRTSQYGPPNYPVSCSAVYAINGNFRKFGATFRHDTVFAPKQCSYQKEATEVDSLKMLSLSGCKTRTSQYGPPNYLVSCSAV